MKGGVLRTIRSTGDSIRLSTGRVGFPRGAGMYPPDFDIVEDDSAVATHEISFDQQLDVFFVPVGHRHGHLGTTP